MRKAIELKSQVVSEIVEKLEDEEVLDELKTIAKPFVLRRLKTDEEIKKNCSHFVGMRSAGKHSVRACIRSRGFLCGRYLPFL